MIETGFLRTADNCRIAFDHYKNAKKDVVVIVHGFYNSKESELMGVLAEHLSKDYDVFAFDLRGHGKSSGLFTWTSREGNDLEAALEFLKGKYEKTAVIGFSMGGSIAVNVLSKGNFKADSLICVSSPCDQSKVDYKWWRLNVENDIVYTLLTPQGRKGKGVRPGWFWFRKEKPIESVGRLKTPVLYIHGGGDWVVGKWHSERMYERTCGKKEMVIIEKGQHAEYLLRRYRDRFFHEMDKWHGFIMKRR